MSRGCGECGGCGARGSCIVSNAADVVWTRVVRGIRGVGEVYEISMCLLGAAWVDRVVCG